MYIPTTVINKHNKLGQSLSRYILLKDFPNLGIMIFMKQSQVRQINEIITMKWVNRGIEIWTYNKYFERVYTTYEKEHLYETNRETN